MQRLRKAMEELLAQPGIKQALLEPYAKDLAEFEALRKRLKSPIFADQFDRLEIERFYEERPKKFFYNKIIITIVPNQSKGTFELDITPTRAVDIKNNIHLDKKLKRRHMSRKKLIKLRLYKGDDYKEFDSWVYLWGYILDIPISKGSSTSVCINKLRIKYGVNVNNQYLSTINVPKLLNVLRKEGYNKLEQIYDDNDIIEQLM